MNPSMGYMYIVVECGLSSIIEYGTTISAVDCAKCSDLHILSGDLHILKNKSQTLTISFVFYEAWLCYLTIVIRYLRGLTLFSLMNVVVL